MRTIIHESNSGPIEVLETGAGSTLIVLLHAAASGPRALIGLARMLAASGRRVWLPALAGYGATELAPRIDPVTAHVDLVRSVLDAAYADSAVERTILMGHSMGGLIGAKAAVGRDDLRALILYEPIVLAAVARDDPVVVADAALVERLAAGVASGEPEPGVAAFVEAWNDIAWSSLPAETRARLIEDASRLARETRAIHRDTTSDGEWEALTARATVVHGDRSPALAAKMAGNLVARLPNASLVTLPGLGHMAPVTVPERIAALIERLIARAG